MIGRTSRLLIAPVGFRFGKYHDNSEGKAHRAGRYANDRITQWLGLGDGFSSPGTLVAAMEGKATLESVVQATVFELL